MDGSGSGGAKVASARDDVEKSLLLASLQDYNEKLVLEVHTLREENEGLLLLNDEKDGLIAERESHFSGAKDAIDRSIRALKENVLGSLRERDRATARVGELERALAQSQERCRGLEESLAESRGEAGRQRDLVSRSLRALAKQKVEATLSLRGLPPPGDHSGDRAERGRQASTALAIPDDEADLVGRMEAEHLLDSVGSALQRKIMSDRCGVLEEEISRANEILRDERDGRLLLEQRQGASQRTISQLISLLFVDKSESQRKKQLVRSILAAAGPKGKKAAGSFRSMKGGRQKGGGSKEMAVSSVQAIEGLLQANSEMEAMRTAHFRLILNLLEDELHLLDMHYDRLLQEKERKKDEDTSRYVQSLIDRVLEELKEKGAQIQIFSGLLKTTQD